MMTTVTARHCEITDLLRERAVSVMDRLEHFSPHTLESHVVFDLVPEGCQTEVRLHVRRGQVLVGSAVGPDHRTALDRAEAKIRRQIERSTTQARRDRRVASMRQ